MKTLKFWTLCLFSFLVMAMGTSCSDDDNNEVDSAIAENKANKEEGEQFLLANKTAEGVVTTFSGLQYKILARGTGEKPILSDSLTLVYTAKLIDGTIFMSDTEDLLLAHQIEGLKEGVRYMPVGSSFVLYLPYYLGYDATERNFSYSGSSVKVKAYSVLMFECKLTRVKHNE